MAQAKYEIVLSTDGKHSVVAETDNQAETKVALAWAKATYEQLVAQHGREGEHLVLAEPAEMVALELEEAPICAVDQEPVVKVNGKKGDFWSCHEKNPDGSWCTYRPARV